MANETQADSVVRGYVTRLRQHLRAVENDPLDADASHGVVVHIVQNLHATRRAAGLPEPSGWGLDV